MALELRAIVGFLLCCAAVSGSAVCLDPATAQSGYRQPLAEELRSTELVAVGKVFRERSSRELARDPNAVSVSLYRVRVQHWVKGRSPKWLEVKVENDSGRYNMSVGEVHLLFLNKSGRDFAINGCGNSSVLPVGEPTLAAVRAALAQPGAAPGPKDQKRP